MSLACSPDPLQGRAGWRPLLTGALRDEALQVATGIGAELWERASLDGQPGEVKSPELGEGEAGVAVFFAHLGQWLPGYRAAAWHFLKCALEGVSASPLSASLFTGFTGVAWARAYICELIGDEPDDDGHSEVEEVLLKLVRRPTGVGPCGLLSGLSGVGVYALERAPGRFSEECLEAIVARLEERAVRRPEGLVWPELDPEGRAVLPPPGVLLGPAGVIALLGRIHALRVLPGRALALLEGAVDWLRSASGQRAQRPESEGRPAGRFGWCQGDLGVAASLLTAARCVGRADWEQAALALAIRAARAGDPAALVQNASLCHGAAGTGHLFNRIYQTTGDPLFAEAALRWFKATLQMRQPGQGIGGFLAHERGLSGEQIRKEGVLLGASGIALALLAAAQESELSWDRMLLASS